MRHMLQYAEPAKAEQHLSALENICLIPCEEYDDLKRAIAKAGDTLRLRSGVCRVLRHYRRCASGLVQSYLPLRLYREA